MGKSCCGIRRRISQSTRNYTSRLSPSCVCSTGLSPSLNSPASKTVRKILIEEDRNRLKKKKDEVYHSQLKLLISAMMRYPGFKYKKSELVECGLYEFMDSVKGCADLCPVDCTS